MAELRLDLFVFGRGERTAAAVAWARALCEDDLGGRAELQVTDVAESPSAARDAGVLATPTLVLAGEGQGRRVVGDLSKASEVLAGLGLSPRRP